MEIFKTRRISKDNVIKTAEMIVTGLKAFIDIPLLKHSKMKSLSNKSNHFILIGKNKDNTKHNEFSGEIGGFLMYRIENDKCLIFEIHVSKEHQGQGYGTRMLEELFKDQKGKIIILFVYKKNTAAIKFYQSRGFKIQEKFESESYYEMYKENY